MSMFVFVAIAMVSLLGIVSYDVHRKYQDKKQIDVRREEINMEIKHWQEIVNTYKDYRDGYFKLAILEYRLKDLEKSKYYLDKALTLDPNFEQGRRFEESLLSM